MPRARANRIEIEYESIGDPEDPPLLLVMGLGAQMILWPDEFCEALADRGHHVVRFDNRDAGLSTRLDPAGLPDVMGALGAVAQGRPVDAPYRLSDMAADAAGLLDALDLPSAHVVGASMGGMIAQTLAIEHPARVRTLTSIMSTTGDPSLPQARPEAMAMLLTPPPTERAAAIEHGVRLWRTIGSPGFAFDEAEVRAMAGRTFDRGPSPAGTARQLVAILASGSRRDALAAVRAPTLVIHGAADPLIPVDAGRATAAAVPGAELLEIEGMGHDLPRALWPTLVDAIAKHAARV
ncbi:MAG TPA: alpha/beta fold hydrolase [Myxococcota bacterium]|nr:alpha/beta fold hydrolase [Myxococcota bacterium]